MLCKFASESMIKYIEKINKANKQNSTNKQSRKTKSFRVQYLALLWRYLSSHNIVNTEY